MAKYKVTEDLEDIIGKKTSSVAEIQELIWKYIKDNKLQSPLDKRYITPDRKLAKLLMVEEGQELDATCIMVILKSHIKGKIKEKDAKCSIIWKLVCLCDFHNYLIIN